MDINTLIDRCLAREVPVTEDGNVYSLGYISNIGEVVTRNDGYYGVIICDFVTPEDDKPYYTNHVKYMTFAPFVLFLIQADSSLLVESSATRLMNELNTLFHFDGAQWYRDNEQYVTRMKLIWVHEIHDCCNQRTDPTDPNTVVYRSTYDFFVNCGIQNVNPEMHIC